MVIIDSMVTTQPEGPVKRVVGFLHDRIAAREDTAASQRAHALFRRAVLG
jgi:hypothetical protein